MFWVVLLKIGYISNVLCQSNNNNFYPKLLVYLTIENHKLYRAFYCDLLRAYIEDIQFFLLNMAFISPSEVENIYIS